MNWYFYVTLDVLFSNKFLKLKLASTVSGNGLLPAGTKQLPEPVLTSY